MRTRRQLALFLAAYVVYDLGRWVAHGDLGPATDHAHWVLDLERSLGVAVERSVQRALDMGPVMWLLSNGFAVAIGIALAAAARRRVTRALCLLWGPLVCLAVVATGNHYVFDIAAGLLVAGAGYVVGRLPRRLPTFLPAPRLALSGETT
jgi:PAP2 superfamily